MRPGERLTLTIEKPAAGGRMIARHDGAVALVSGAIPGETIEASVEKVQRGTIWAKTTRVIEASSDRVGDAEDRACGGNVLAHIRYPRQLDLKRDIIRDAFARIGKMTVPGDIDVTGSAVDGYRMRARLHVQRGRVGFFREGTHTLCDPVSTRQLLPAAIDAIAAVEAHLSSEPRADGIDLELSENIAGSERALHVEGVDERVGAALRAMPAIGALTGISFSRRGSEVSTTVAGSPDVSDSIVVPAGSVPIGITLTRHAHSYFQGNRYLLAELIGAVVGAVPAGEVQDLYAGVGPFALALARRGDTTVVAVEGDSRSAADLVRNAVGGNGRVTVRHRAVESFLADRSPASGGTIVVDPPRTGMSREAVDGVVGRRPERIVYVSCDVATLARDARIVVDAGYRLTAMRAFDMFPNTAHIETLALFDR